jgi:hypothetical protein
MININLRDITASSTRIYGCNQAELFGNQCQENSELKEKKEKIHDEALEIHNEVKIITFDDATFAL